MIFYSKNGANEMNLQGSQESQGTSMGTPQRLQHVAARRKLLDTVHHWYFVSANRLNVQQIAESKLQQEKLKMDVQVAKLKKQHLLKVLQQVELDKKTTALKQCKLELEIFQMERDISAAAGIQGCPATDIQLLTMNTLFIDVPQQPATVSQHPVTMNPVPAPTDAVEEIMVPSSVAEVHDQVLKDIAENKDVRDVLHTIWCKPFQGNLVDFVKDNVHIALAISKSEQLTKLTPQASGGGSFIGFNRLS